MQFLLPIIAAAALWWLSTGVILGLTRLPSATWRWTAGCASLLGVAGTAAVFFLRPMETPAAAYMGFAAGIAVWAFHEVMFLFGYIAGPHREPCPKGLALGPRFRAAAGAVLHHEIGIALHGLILLALSWGAPNSVAAQTYFLLWVMRLSVKFVLFFGTPRLPNHVMPPHLDYLASYFRQHTNGAYLAIAGVLTTAIAMALIVMALTSIAGSFAFTAYLLLATLAALAVLEHAALGLHVPDRLLGVSPSPARVARPKTSTQEPSRI